MKHVNYNIRLPQQMYKDLKKLSDQEYTSMASIIRRAIKKYLKDLKTIE